MDVGRFVKVVVVAVIAILVWRFGISRWKESRVDSASATSSASPNSNCVKRAEAASEMWGGGLRQFVSPPYDINAWSTFRNDVDSKINNALADCGCSDASCQKASAAMSVALSAVTSV